MRTSLRVALASVVFMIVATIFAPFAEAAMTVCGGCFCKAGSGSSGGYSCVKVMGYNRWMPDA